MELVKAKALLSGEFTFTAGAKSPVYMDGRLITLSSEGALLVGELVFELLSGKNIQAIGGPALGAVPIVAAAVVVSQIRRIPMDGFLVREVTKAHGTQKLVEGILPEKGRVAIVEDVVSTGTSVFRAIQAAEDAGCQVVMVIALLDWQKGGSDELKRRGYDFFPILKGDTGSGKVTLAADW